MRDESGSDAGGPNIRAALCGRSSQFRRIERTQGGECKEVIRWEIEGLSQTIASTKRIGGYEIWQEDLPRTTTRKLKRFEIEKQVRANQGKRKETDDAEVATKRPLTSEDESWLAKSDVQRAIALIRESRLKAPEQVLPDR